MIVTRSNHSAGAYRYAVDGQHFRSGKVRYEFAARTTISKEGYSAPVVVVTLHTSRAAALAGAKDNIWAARLGTSAQRKSRYESAADYKARANVPAPIVVIATFPIIAI